MTSDVPQRGKTTHRARRRCRSGPGAWRGMARRAHRDGDHRRHRTRCRRAPRSAARAGLDAFLERYDPGDGRSEADRQHGAHDHGLRPAASLEGPRAWEWVLRDHPVLSSLAGGRFASRTYEMQARARNDEGEGALVADRRGDDLGRQRAAGVVGRLAVRCHGNRRRLRTVVRTAERLSGSRSRSRSSTITSRNRTGGEIDRCFGGKPKVGVFH